MIFRPVAGEQTDARAHGRARRGQIRRLAVDQNGPVMGHGAEQGAADFFLARASQAHKAEQFALANVEVDRARPRRLEAAHDDPGPPWSALAFVEKLERRAADDEANELVGIGLAHGLLTDEAPVAHHNDPVGDAKDLVEAMRDIDHADAAAPQAPHRLEQTLDLVGRQACGRLVQHEEIAIDDERAGDRDQRLLGPAQASNPSARIHPAADQRERLFGPALGARPVDRRKWQA